MRPDVTTQGFTNLLLSSHKDDAAGQWDGRTYESATFDPGTLSTPTIFTTSVNFSDGTNLKQVDEIIDVQPLPEWITKSRSVDDAEFNTSDINFSGSTNGFYTFTGILATLPLSTHSVIPVKVPLIGGSLVGASASLGIIASIPLDPASIPTVVTYEQVKVTIVGTQFFNKMYYSSSSIGTEETGKFTATPEFTLNPETLQPGAGFGIDFMFSLNTTLLSKDFAAGQIKVKGLKIPLHLSTNLGIMLTENANIVLTPDHGFSLTPSEAITKLGVKAVFSGNVGYEKSISKGGKPITVKLEGVASGSLTLSYRVNYSGDITSITSDIVQFEGQFDPSIQGIVSLTNGKRVIFKKSSPNILSIFIDKLPVQF